MAYQANFLHVVFGGALYDDTWNSGFNLVNFADTSPWNMPDLTPANVAALAAIVNSFLGSTGATGLQMNGSASVKFFKINEIGEDGRYVSNVTNEYIYPAPGAGGGAGGIPAQLSTVVTLRTAVDRGLASKGRMYLPACAGYQVADLTGRAASSDALRVSNRVAVFINDFTAAINAFPQFSGANRVAFGIVSKARSGGQNVVTDVSTGRVVDTMRSRRNKLIESPVANVTAVVPVV